MSAGVWGDHDSRTVLYGRVPEALERSAWLAVEQPERGRRRNVRSREALDEQERARRAGRIAARTRAMLR
jgi:hypothetical protein